MLQVSSKTLPLILVHSPLAPLHFWRLKFPMVLIILAVGESADLVSCRMLFNWVLSCVLCAIILELEVWERQSMSVRVSQGEVLQSWCWSWEEGSINPYLSDAVCLPSLVCSCLHLLPWTLLEKSHEPCYLKGWIVKFHSPRRSWTNRWELLARGSASVSLSQLFVQSL